MRDFQSTILSQYAASPVITGLIDYENQWLDPFALFNDFYDNVWNLDTAVGYGLDVWGRILGKNRVLQISAGSWFGFKEATDAQPFGQGIFYAGGGSTQNFYLGDDAYRLLLFAKAAANIWDGSIPAFNQILLNLFPGRGDIYVTDGENMTMTVHSTFVLAPFEIAILTTANVLPIPTGVVYSLVHP